MGEDFTFISVVEWDGSIWEDEQEEAAEGFTEAQLRLCHAEATDLVMALRKLFGSDYREFELAARDY